MSDRQCNFVIASFPEYESQKGDNFVTAVLRIKTEDEAREFVAQYREWIKQNFPDYPADKVVAENIGWCFGEGMPDEQAEIWQRVCGAYHPFFERNPRTAEEALRLGYELAKIFSARGKKPSRGDCD